ncbi:MAG: hypothetical protein LUQ25_05190 [Methanoregulaceae archaeon]|nr:hypothetical protein [Methanoregulaceae archaeon]
MGPANPNMSMIRVLLVGCEQVIQGTVKETGQPPENIQYLSAGSGSEAKVIIRKDRPHLVISRSDLPDMSGGDLAGTVQKEVPCLPFVILPEGMQIPWEFLEWLGGGSCPPDDDCGMGMASAALPVANATLNKANSQVRHAILNHLTILLGYLEIASEMKGQEFPAAFMEKISQAASAIHRCVLLTRDYQGIGQVPPCWHPLSSVLRESASLSDIVLSGPVGETANVYGDQILGKAFVRIFSMIRDSTGDGGRAEYEVGEMSGDMIVTIRCTDERIQWNEGAENVELAPTNLNARSVFPAREILAITGIGVQVSGKPGTLAIGIRIPGGMYRKAGLPRIP